MGEYQSLQRGLAKGWNTWNTRSVLSHVLLPEGFAINLCLKEYASRTYLKEALIGRKGNNVGHVRPGPHSYDGSYTELSLRWENIEVIVQSGIEEGDLVLLVTPVAQPNHKRPALCVVEMGVLWNRPGHVGHEAECIVGHLPTRSIPVYATQQSLVDPYIPSQTPYLSVPLDSVVGISTGKGRSLKDIQSILEKRKAEQHARTKQFGDLSDVYSAIQSVLAWNTIYEPEKDRVVTPVSRPFSLHWGGFVLFEWDTYFVAYMAALDNRELAYANAIEITHERTEEGFVPNESFVCGLKSRGWSQPPVGSLIVNKLYQRFGDRWFLEELFDDLLSWNRWWSSNRNHDGLLCWGANSYEPVMGIPYEYDGANAWQGALWESGLDNSPMYDGVPFNQHTHLLELEDVGLNGLYVADCEALADIADILGRAKEKDELRHREQTFRKSLSRLWNKERGIYLNLRTDTSKYSSRLSPTHFYPLLGRVPNDAQAKRMIEEHFYNPDEFWGEWIMPSIARDDPAYQDQDYWRGRIWGPMNFLVYLGLKRYPFPQACADLAEKSKRLLMKEWLERGHVHENYCTETGEGCDRPNSDPFYHWGGLLGILALIEAGYMT